jgi:hypothetical protein
MSEPAKRAREDPSPSPPNFEMTEDEQEQILMDALLYLTEHLQTAIDGARVDTPSRVLSYLHADEQAVSFTCAFKK